MKIMKRQRATDLLRPSLWMENCMQLRHNGDATRLSCVAFSDSTILVRQTWIQHGCARPPIRETLTHP